MAVSSGSTILTFSQYVTLFFCHSTKNVAMKLRVLGIDIILMGAAFNFLLSIITEMTQMMTQIMML
jgi:hypothetical protein